MDIVYRATVVVDICGGASIRSCTPADGCSCQQEARTSMYMQQTHSVAHICTPSVVYTDDWHSSGQHPVRSRLVFTARALLLPLQCCVDWHRSAQNSAVSQTSFYSQCSAAACEKMILEWVPPFCIVSVLVQCLVLGASACAAWLCQLCCLIQW